MDYANVDEQNLNFENLSGGESAEESIIEEEEDRSNEIKELFAAAFSEETFDEDEDDDDDDESEHSFARNSKDQSSSIHLNTNNNIGNSNNIKSNLIRTSNHHPQNKQVVPIKKVTNVGLNEILTPNSTTTTTATNNKHKTTTTTTNTFVTTKNENGLNSFFNGIGLDQNNHKINGSSSSNTGGFIMNGSNNSNNISNNNNSNGAGNSGGKKVVRFQQQQNSSSTTTTNNKSNDPAIGNQNGNKGRQSERGVDEIEITNPTISLLHQNHCPQNGDEISSELWTESVNDLEQLKTLCQLRERQVERSEENVKLLEKDKRSLNHQIGLMKTEMIQMKKQQDDLEKLLQQREEDIRYLKTKMIEAIEEYEQAQREEKYAKDECLRYRDEIEKLKQQVESLSSIGTSSQQAEIDQVVRQIREKHTKEVSMWQQTVSELESQLMAYKRQQHSIHDESIIIEKENISIQTDPIPIPQPIIVQKKSTTEFGQTVNFISQTFQPPSSFKSHKIQNLPSCSGAGGDADIIDQSLSNGYENIRLEKWKQAFAKSEEEKNRLIDFYEREMEDYKTKLALLPSQLYRQWQNQQEELGLLYANNISSTTITPVGTPGKTLVPTRDASTETIQILSKGVNIQTDQQREHMVDGQQKLLKNDSNSNEIVAQVKLRNSSTNKTCDSTFQSQSQTNNNEKEHSSVIIQTEETFETYQVLGTLIEQWAKEVAESTKRAEQAEKELQLRKEELQKVAGKYRELQTTYFNSKKQWRQDEKLLNQKIEENKERCITILSHVQEKLDIFE